MSSDTIIVVVKETQTVIVSAPGPQGIPGPGFPAGGTAGQGLVKNSSTNFDTAWGVPGLDISSSWTKQQYHPVSTLSINGDYSIDWNWDTQPLSVVNLASGQTYTLHMPTNRQPGIKTLRAYQNATGGGILNFSSGYTIDLTINSLTFVGNSFADIYFKDDGTYITVFGAEYLP